jgi:hypothetical protein
MGEKATISAGRRRLFLDGKGITEIKDLKRTMHQPTKKGAVIRPDLARGGCLQTRCAPAWDPEEKLYKILLIGDAGSCYSESVDGVHWTRPFHVSVDPTLVWPQNGILNMVIDPDEEDRSKRFKALGYNTDTGMSELNFDRQPLVSPDCKNWSRLHVRELIPAQDESNLSYDPIEHIFMATLKTHGPFGRSVDLSTSSDFISWTKPEMIFHADEQDQELGSENIRQRIKDDRFAPLAYDMPGTYNVDVYNMGIFRYEDIYIGLPSMYHMTGRTKSDWGGFHHIQLASSRDLKHWDRLGDRRPFLDCSPANAGAYDLSTVLGISSPVFMDDELWFYYTGLKQYGGSDHEKDNGAVCLASLRRDGFISLDPGGSEGYMMTEPFILTEGSIHLNVDASGGYAYAALSSADGEAMSGFERSHAFTGNCCDTEMAWDNDSIASLVGKRVRLTIKLNRAQLYSWWIA